MNGAFTVRQIAHGISTITGQKKKQNTAVRNKTFI